MWGALGERRPAQLNESFPERMHPPHPLLPLLGRLLCCMLTLGFGFRVSGFGFPISGFGFRVEELGFRVSSFGFRV